MYKISIIIPIYRSERYIERCTTSLMEQTLDRIQYIFVDDCSPDNSLNILRETLSKYPQKSNDILIISNNTNSGPSITRNKGISYAQGNFLAFCDSDDWVEPTMYEKLYSRCVKENADIGFCDINIINKENIKNPFNCYTDHYSNKESFIRNFISSKWTPLYNCIVKKDLVIHNKITLPINITYCEDFHFMIRVIYHASTITKENSPLYNYNEDNEGSIMHNLSKYSGIDDMKCYLETIDFFTREGCIDKYEKEMSWRVLNAFHLDMFIPQKHKQICAIYPTCHKYILSNPFYIKRQKQLMWLLTHHCRWIVLCFLSIRKFLNLQKTLKSNDIKTSSFSNDT